MLAIVLAVAFVQVPLVEKALLRVAIASYCLPIIAIGPILTFVLNGDAPKSALAGLLVFFPTLVGVVVGLRSADRAALDRDPGRRGRLVGAAAQGAAARRHAQHLRRPPGRGPLGHPRAPSSASTSAPSATGSGS